VQIMVAVLPYNLAWMNDFFNELATLLFYMMVGYKLRPAPNNPYLQVDTDDDAPVEEIQLESVSGVPHKRKVTTVSTEV